MVQVIKEQETRLGTLLIAQVSARHSGVCQGSCRVSYFLSGLFILPLRVQIYRTDGCPIACAA